SGPCTIYRRISRFFRPEIPSAQARTGTARLWFQSRLLTRKKLGSIPKCNRMTHRPHSVKVEAQVVNRVQNLSQYFVRCIQMPKISSRVPGTNTAAAVRIEWASVSSVACLLDRNFSFRRKQQTMPRRPSGGGSPRPPSRGTLGFRSAGVSPPMRAWTAGGGCPYVAPAPRHFVLVLSKIFSAPSRPAQRQLHRRAHAARLRRIFRTFIN